MNRNIITKKKKSPKICFCPPPHFKFLKFVLFKYFDQKKGWREGKGFFFVPPFYSVNQNEITKFKKK